MVLPTAVMLFISIVFGVMLLRSVVLVAPGSVVIVERLGKYAMTLQPGLHLLVPIVDHARTRVDMTEQRSTWPELGVTATWTVVDPVRATYEVDAGTIGDAMAKLVPATIESIVRDAQDGDDFSRRVRDAVSGAAARWGVRVDHLELRASSTDAASTPAPAHEHRGPFVE